MLTGAILTMALGGAMVDGTFGDDVAFLKQHADPVVLRNGTGAVVVVPKYQGRVMTSSSNGDAGMGYGWINRELIESGEVKANFNPLGGEERFWLGPEGGQFSLYFKKGDPFAFDKWQVPPAIDTEPYKVVSKSASSISLSHTATFTNYSGNQLKVGIKRRIRLLGPTTLKSRLGVDTPAGVKSVAYDATSTITNSGSKTWTKTTGAPSIWILSMFKPGDQTNVVVPYNTKASGTVLVDNYFGKVPADRLKIGKTAAYFRCDGTMRTKIGLPPARVKPYRDGAAIGSYDAANNVLTILHFSYEPGVKDYVNSLWEMQKEPFRGDVANSYNDGPPAPGVKPMGPFYELESSSPALFLKPGASRSHSHMIAHFEGPREKLDGLAKKILGVGLDEISGAFKE